MKKSNKVTFLTQAAVIAAIYVVLTIIFAPSQLIRMMQV